MAVYICPSCSGRTSITPDQVGETVECPHCRMMGVAYGVNVVEDSPEQAAAPTQPSADQPTAPLAEPAAARVEVQRVGARGPVLGGKTAHPCAILSLVCGIVGLFAPIAAGVCCCALPMLMLGIGAIVVGIVALTQIKAQPARYSGRGMAIAGIVLGSIGPILAVLVVVLLIVARSISAGM